MGQATRVARSVKSPSRGFVWGRSVCSGHHACSGLLSAGVLSVLHREAGRCEAVGLVLWCLGERPWMVLRWMDGSPLVIYPRRASCVASGARCAS